MTGSPPVQGVGDLLGEEFPTADAGHGVVGLAGATPAAYRAEPLLQTGGLAALGGRQQRRPTPDIGEAVRLQLFFREAGQP